MRYQPVGAPEFGQCIDAGGKRQQITGRKNLFVEIRLFKFRPAANGEQIQSVGSGDPALGSGFTDQKGVGLDFEFRFVHPRLLTRGLIL